MAISARRLRRNLYSIPDRVIETGVPVEVQRNGRTLRIVAERTRSKWGRLEARKIVNGDPDDLVHFDWSSEWKGRDAPS